MARNGEFLRNAKPHVTLFAASAVEFRGNITHGPMRIRLKITDGDEDHEFELVLRVTSGGALIWTMSIRETKYDKMVNEFIDGLEDRMLKVLDVDVENLRPVRKAIVDWEE